MSTNNPKAQFQINNGNGWQTIAEAEIIDGIAQTPIEWAAIEGFEKRISYTGYTPVGTIVVPDNPRDTHFAGFAKLLVDELKVTGGYPISEVKQLIARRAYDFACHVATYTQLTAHGDMSKIPDLPELPEVEE